jgi:hypothetical protein
METEDKNVTELKKLIAEETKNRNATLEYVKKLVEESEKIKASQATT